MPDPMSAPTDAPANAPASGSPPEADRQALARAAELGRPVRRVAAVASFQGSVYSILGVLSLMFALPGGIDWLGAAIGAALLAIGLAERGASRRLAAGDARAAVQAARIELVALCGIAAWCLLQMYGPRDPQLEQLTGDVRQQLGIDIQALTMSVYPTVLAVSIVVQGLLARYFYTRRADVARYRDEAPEWARRIVEDTLRPGRP